MVNKNYSSEDDQLLPETEQSATPGATEAGAIMVEAERSESPVASEDRAPLAETERFESSSHRKRSPLS